MYTYIYIYVYNFICMRIYIYIYCYIMPYNVLVYVVIYANNITRMNQHAKKKRSQRKKAVQR